MIQGFFSLFQKPSTSISVPIHPPYYEIRDKIGNLAGCISGTHHNLAPNAQFEPAPTMQKCFDRATTLLVETDKTAVKEIMRRKLLQQGTSAQIINEHFHQADLKDNSIDRAWEKKAKTEHKPIKGLESPKDAFRAAMKIAIEETQTPEKQQEKCLKWTSDFLQGSDVKTQDYFQNCFINKKRTLPEFFDRNEVMASGINKTIQSGSLPFTAIGFGHCLGEKGVPQILKKRYGFDVREIKPNPPSLVQVPTNP